MRRCEGACYVERLRHNSIHFSLPVSCEHFRNLVIVANATRTVIVVIISALSFRSRRAYWYALMVIVKTFGFNRKFKK